MTHKERKAKDKEFEIKTVGYIVGGMIVLILILGIVS